MNTKEYSAEVGGKNFTATFTDLAAQANSSVLMRLGNTVVLATAVMSDEAQEDIGYFPLVVDYEEKFYAAGQILGSRFVRREGRPSDEAVLSGRAVDRTIRPLFEDHIRNSVQVVITILSLDKDDPDILAINAASIALATSDIPWNGPVSAVRIGKSRGNDEFIINPDYEFRQKPDTELDIVVCGKDGAINMIELGAYEVSEDVVVRALEKAKEEIEKMQQFQKSLVKEVGKEKVVIKKEEIKEETKKLFDELIRPKMAEMLFQEPGKDGGAVLLREWKNLVEERLPEEKVSLAVKYLDGEVNELLHKEALENGRRADGRSFDEIRGLFAQAGGLPMLHGSGIFYRGGTHVLSALTLGSPGDSQIIDGMEVQTTKRFFHHYNFPPFSTGETGRIGGFNRRMIGHGALAEKALSPVIPPKEEFPYTIRIVSEALSSNGSTSMGSVCGSTLALLDAGVPIKAPVSGIAMGLMTDGKNYKILTDIQGPEDHHGDMDLKVAGTRDGITAIQMDVKVDSVPIEVLKDAFSQAKTARLKILDKIGEAIPAPREELSPHAPRILIIKIKQDQIGLLIGPGGKTVNAIRDVTGAEIDIEDDGTVYISSRGEGVEEAKEKILELTKIYEVGERFEGEVTRILDFGAFVKIGHDAEGLVHISEIAPFRIESVEGVLSIGEKVPVVVKEIDEKDRINLSIKDADTDFAKRKGLKPAANSRNGSHGRNQNRNYRNNGGRHR